jgi:hypothetical protein
MASNNYTSANVVPSADTFREWVDLTNRITYDMEKVVVTVAANTQGARTSGNASVNGYFSANTLIVEQEMRGADATSSVYGTKAASANLVIVSNTVFKANATHASIIHAQANIHHTGANAEFGSDVSINSSSAVFSSNAVLNDFNSNVDIDNAITDITSTNLAITGTETNIDSNTVFTANVNITSDSADLNISSDEVIITTDTSLFKSTATLNDFNSNVDIDNALTTITSTNTVIENGELNLTSNVNFDAESFDILDGAFNVTQSNSTTHAINIDPTTNTFTSNAGLNVFNTPLDINANIDIDNADTNINATAFFLKGVNARIESAGLDVHGTSFDVDSNTTIDGATLVVASTSTFNGDVTANANVTIGNANSDLLNVVSNTVLNDKLNVKKAVDFDTTLNVDGATTLNGAVTLGDATGDDLTFTGYSATGITPKATGTLSLGTASLRWDGMFDDLRADDLTVDDDAGIGGDLTVDTNTQLDGTLTVNTALSIEYTGAGSAVRLVTVGAGVTANDKIIINSQVGNSTIGLMPAAGNTVPFGNNTNRWVITGKTGTFSSTLAAGDTTITGFMKASGEVEGGSLDINGVADISGNVDMHDGLDLEGTFNHSSGAHTITGAATFANTVGITGAITGSNTLVVNGTATFANTSLVKILNTDEPVANVSGNFAALKVEGGIFAEKNIRTKLELDSATARLRGPGLALQVDTQANVGGSLAVGGATTLGDATGDTVTMNGYVSSMIPSANSNSLGINTKRWTAAFMTANTATTLAVGTSATVGTSLDVGTHADVGTDLTVGDDIFLTATGNIIFSNTGEPTWTKTTVSGNNISVDYLQVQKGLTFPNTVTLIANTLGGTELEVTNTAHFTGAGATESYNPTVTFGSGTNTVFIDTTAGRFITDIRPSTTNTRDVGTAALSWKTGYFDTSLVVGDTVANTTALLANNVYATDDLVASYSSDRNLKDNLLVINDALNKVEQIGGYSYTWNNRIEDDRVGKQDYGVIAQEIEEILPAAVKMNSRGHRTVSYNAIISLLVEAIKELSAKVDELTRGEEE